MRRELIKLILLTIVSFHLTSCGKDVVTDIEIVSKQTKDSADFLSIKSKVLSNKEIEDDGVRKIRIDLPPDYYKSKKRYPVVYYFHGHGGCENEFAESGILDSLQKKFSSGKQKPYIIVSINGDNKFGGSFYVNSKLAGNWEDHFINEVVPLIDNSYRTIPEKSSRALAGFSMGGFGVLHIGLKYSRYFSGIWAICPGVFAEEKGLQDSLTTWKYWPAILKSYGAAFADDSEHYPTGEKPDENKELYTKWVNGFGGWNNRISQYKQNNSEVRVKISIGEKDSFLWIKEGSKYLHQLLKKNKIDSSIHEHVIGHSLSREAFFVDAAPFFQRLFNGK